MAAKKKTRGCKCLDKVDKELAHRNARVLRTIPFAKGAVPKALVEVEKLHHAIRQKPPRLAANYCPFCGVPYEADRSGLESAPERKRRSVLPGEEHSR